MDIPSEDFLHFIWKTKSFDLAHLKTTKGQDIQISNFGLHNHDAGPDFSNAKVIIDGQVWHGNIEIHILASDWKKHKHDANPNYDSVILHVVYEDDKPIYNSHVQTIPTLELKSRLTENTLRTYARLQASPDDHWIPCQSMFSQVTDIRKSIFQERLTIERLEYKTEFAKTIYEEEKGDWYMLFVRMLLIAFGGKVNKEAFSVLGERLDKRLLLQCSQDLETLESYLFGIAGFLTNSDDDYSNELSKKYEFLRIKHTLIQLPENIWKFSRMRPQNFPTLRLAQFSALLHQNKGILEMILDLSVQLKPNEMFKVELSPYWDTHFKLGTESPHSKKKIGQGMQDLIMINCFAPFLFIYGQLHDDQRYKDKAIDILGVTNAEKNSITKQWEQLGMENKSARNSQALIHLKNNYCSKMKCLSCDIGYALIKSE